MQNEALASFLLLRAGYVLGALLRMSIAQLNRELLMSVWPHLRPSRQRVHKESNLPTRTSMATQAVEELKGSLER